MVLCFLAGVSAGFLAEPARAAGESDAGIAVVVKTVAVEAVHGRLLTMSLRDGAVVWQRVAQRSSLPSGPLPSADEVHIPTADIVRITPLMGGGTPGASTSPLSDRLGEPERWSPRKRDQRVSLIAGDVLFGQVMETREDMVVIDTADLGSVTIPLDVVTRIDTAKAFLPAHRDAVAWLDGGRPLHRLETGATSFASAPRGGRTQWEDRILLTNGDLLGGFVTSINSGGFSVDTESGEITVPHRLIVAVRFASAMGRSAVGSASQPVSGFAGEWEAVSGGTPTPHRLQSGAIPPSDGQSAKRISALPASDRLHFILRCRTSGRLTLTDLAWSGNVVNVRLPHGLVVSIEAERIVSLDVVGGRWEWLSSRRPISYEHTPMLSLDWPWVNNRNVLGGPLTVAGQTYEHGVGVHSRSNLRYDLAGVCREFVTSFGIDDDSGPWADVSVFILVDGQRRFSRVGVKPGTLHGPIRLDVALAKGLELVVDFGENGDLQDRFNWIEAALIRK